MKPRVSLWPVFFIVTGIAGFVSIWAVNEVFGIQSIAHDRAVLGMLVIILFGVIGFERDLRKRNHAHKKEPITS